MMEADEIKQIVRNVRERIRTKAELQRYGCENCKEGLRILKEGEKDDN